MESLVSIIIPAYNAGKLIKTSLESIISQTYRFYEIIIVNDGSTDDTLEVVERFKEEHSEKSIKIIDIENGGVSNARNTGIENAEGKWICFVDADDYLEPNYLEVLVSNWKPMRWVLCHFYKIEKNTKLKVNKLSGAKAKNEIVNLFLDSLISQPWNKLFEKSIIDEYNIRFDTKLSLAEDFFFNMDYYDHCNEIYVIDAPLYNYLVLESGLNISEKKRNAYIPILVRQCERLYKNIRSLTDKGQLYELDHHMIVQAWQYTNAIRTDLKDVPYYVSVEKNMVANSFLFLLIALLQKIGVRKVSIVFLKVLKKVRKVLKADYTDKVPRN